MTMTSTCSIISWERRGSSHPGSGTGRSRKCLCPTCSQPKGSCSVGGGHVGAGNPIQGTAAQHAVMSEPQNIGDAIIGDAEYDQMPWFMDTLRRIGNAVPAVPQHGTRRSASPERGPTRHLPVAGL